MSNSKTGGLLYPTQAHKFAAMVRPIGKTEMPLAFLIDMIGRAEKDPWPIANVWDIPGAEGLDPRRFVQQMPRFVRAAQADPRKYLSALYELSRARINPYINAPDPTGSRRLVEMVQGDIREGMAAAQFAAGVGPFRSSHPPMNLSDHALRVVRALGEYRKQLVKSYDPEKVVKQSAEPAKAAVRANGNAMLASTRNAIANNALVQMDGAIAKSAEDVSRAAQQAYDLAERFANDAWNATAGAASSAFGWVKWAAIGGGGLALLYVGSKIYRNFRGGVMLATG